MSEFDRDKYNEIAKFFSKTDKRYINVKVYTYDGGEVKLTLSPAVKNTNEDCDPKKKWLNQKGISGLSKVEAEALRTALDNAIAKM